MKTKTPLYGLDVIESPLANWACSHPFYDLVFQWLSQRIRWLSEPAVLLVIGPTGVGKSTLIAHLITHLAHQITGEMQTDRSKLHKVYAEAVYLPARGFDWEGLFTALLKDANEILINKKVGKAWPPEKPNLRGLADAVNHMLLHHTPPVCIIDEGGTFLEATSEESLNRTLEFLKSIGNRSKTHIAIFGDYRLAKMMQFNGQLNRRCQIIHFSNYTRAYKDKFEDVVSTFEARLRVQNVNVHLGDTADLLFTGTCGCVGLLKLWLENAWISVRGTDQILDKSILESEAFPAGSIAKWNAEIHAGHETMEFFINGKKRT